MSKKLYKISDQKKIAGVCAGIAEYLDIDVTVIRIITLVLILCLGTGLLAYIACALIMPDKNTLM